MMKIYENYATYRETSLTMSTFDRIVKAVSEGYMVIPFYISLSKNFRCTGNLL